MSITCKEDHRLGNRVNIKVVGGDYDCYVDAADWDSDPQAVAAKLADYLAKQPQPEVAKPAVNKDAVVMSDKEVSDKLAELNKPPAKDEPNGN